MRKPMFLFVALLLGSAASADVRADEAFVASCQEAMAGGPGGGEMICGCFEEGLANGAEADELLAIARAPRDERREVVQSASNGTRKVMRGCMQKMRGGAGPRDGGPRGGGQREGGSE